MIVADFIKINSEMLKLLSRFDIKVGDFRHIDLYSDYVEMVACGNKISYVVTYLSGKYHISEASIYRILKRFKTTIRL